ncbi:MAG: type II secretion system F family protein [Proteobacteria bacterium]|nr:type II secretion system F family protein [Pseudomonadota bacterium]
MNVEQPLLFWGLIGGALLLVVTAVLVLTREAKARDLRNRVQIVSSGTTILVPGSAGGDREREVSLGSLVRRLGDWIRESGKMYSEKDIDLLSSVIAAAGHEPRTWLPIVLGAKVLFLAGSLLAVIAYCIITDAEFGRWMVLLALAMPFGIMVPEAILKFLRRRHAKALSRGLPDALDLLVVCTEAGLGLETAMDQVSREMRGSNPEIAVAFANFLDELRVLPDRREAFVNFGRRSGVEGIRRMATVLAQTLQLGTPLGQALRSMAGELRRERMTKLEEKAVRLPGLLVFPLIFCILPVLLITLVGPSMLSLMDMLQQSSRSMGGR